MKILLSIINLSILIYLLTSCCGFKVLTIRNASNTDATIIVKPGLNNFETQNITDYPSHHQFFNSSKLILKPDSTMIMLSIFTSMMFNVKIKERELRTDYLKIKTENDSVIANSKEEIIKLIYNKKSKKSLISSKGRNWITLTIKNK